MELTKGQVKRWLDESDIRVVAYWMIDGEEDEEIEVGNLEIDDAVLGITNKAEQEIESLLTQWAEGRERQHPHSH